MNWLPDERYRVDGVEAIDSPAVVVFPDVIAANIDRALELTATPGGHCLQPHIKSVKCAEVARMALDRGIDRFKCSTVSEGELLGSVGAREVLLSYQLSMVKARRWQRLRQLYPDTAFAALVDNTTTASQLSELFADDPLPVYVDVNPGMDRTGIRMDDVPQLLSDLRTLPGVRLRGFHVYDGHIRADTLAERERAARRGIEAVAAIRAEEETHGGTPLEIIVAGSPNFPFYVGRRDVWVSPGTFFLWDAGYGATFSEWAFEPAALVLTRVVSVIDDRKLCLDIGSKAISPDKAQPRMYLPALPGLEVVGQWEEHLVVSIPDTRNYRVGDAFWAVPMHVCTTVNLYEELLPAREGAIGPAWRTVARDRRITV